MNNKEILEKTLDILKTDGWCKGSQINLQGQRCILGGLNNVTGISIPERVVDELSACVRETELAAKGPREDKFNGGDWTKAVAQFLLAGYNNDPEVSFEDIVNLIECAIKKVE